MSKGRKKMLGAFAASMVIALGAPVAAPVSAQTGAGTGDGDNPYTCNFRDDYYSCCPRYGPCTQFVIDAPPPPPEEPEDSAPPPKN